jgi:hypothetical protein
MDSPVTISSKVVMAWILMISSRPRRTVSTMPLRCFSMVSSEAPVRTAS